MPAGAETPLKRAMRAKGMSYSDLLEATDYTRTWIHRVANGRVGTSRKLRRALARALDVPESELFNEDGYSRDAAPSSNGDGRETDADRAAREERARVRAERAREERARVRAERARAERDRVRARLRARAALGRLAPETQLRRVLRDRGITQRDLAQAIAYTESALSKVAAGQVRPRPNLRRAIARALELPEGELFDEDGCCREAGPTGDGAGR